MNIYKPMLPLPTPESFDDSDWFFEVKWDGLRTLAYITDKVSLRSRSGEELLEKFPEFSELSELASNVVLDGEIIVMKDKIPDFDAVMRRIQANTAEEIQKLAFSDSATFVVFDILERNGASLIDLSLMDRLEVLGFVLKTGENVVQGTIFDENGVNYYEAVVKQGLEGIIAKRKDSLYMPGSMSPDWLMIDKKTG
jgi:bifunctional non-homologous end joining protein LigD